MKMLFMLGIASCATAAFAQNPYSGVGPMGAGIFSGGGPGNVTVGNAYGFAPQQPGVPLGDDITPTMQRERAALAQRVHAAFPELRGEMARAPSYRARTLFERAARKLRWTEKDDVAGS